MKTKVLYVKNRPNLDEIQKTLGVKHCIFIYDEALRRDLDFCQWVKKFPMTYSVSGGESLKSLDLFPSLVRDVLPMVANHSASEIAIVACGGGSVGDAIGFLASVIKRGVFLVHIPTTWLSAVDSAHGGKTALNVDAYKNQVGTFYPAHLVYCVKDILLNLSEDHLRSGAGEMIKMALLKGGKLFSEFQKKKSLTAENYWRILPHVVEAKYQVVKKDPFEKQGHRIILNFGHTLAHALELEQLMAHGLAVQCGMEFALNWSFRKGLLSEKNFSKIKVLMAKNPVSTAQPLRVNRLRQILGQDKKSLAGDRIRFVYLKKPGSPVVQSVSQDEILQAAVELGWAR